MTLGAGPSRGLGSEGLSEHPPGSLASDLVEVRADVRAEAFTWGFSAPPFGSYDLFLVDLETGAIIDRCAPAAHIAP